MMRSMSLKLDLVGKPTEPVLRQWTERDTLLYALAVGAGADDPAAELSFTTENSEGVDQQVIPSFGCLISGSRSPRDLGDYDYAKLLHAEQAVVFHEPLRVSGSVHAVSTLVGVYDKGNAALLVQESAATDAATGRPLVTAKAGFFIRGEGGFGGERGSAGAPWELPDRAPDHEVTYRTRRDQPLLYRLTGDRNPLHSDPKVAARAGFPRPILHGMCTYGFTCRALVHTLGDSEPARLHSMSARFSRPVMPGDELTVRIWTGGGQAVFQTVNTTGEVVLDRGVAEYDQR
jgi:acyl dehydratase